MRGTFQSLLHSRCAPARKHLLVSEVSAWDDDGVSTSGVLLPPCACVRPGVLGSMHGLGVDAADDRLDSVEWVPITCFEALPLLLLPQSEDRPASDSESDEKSSESVSPASAVRRRRRSVTPSRLRMWQLNRQLCKEIYGAACPHAEWYRQLQGRSVRPVGAACPPGTDISRV